MCFKTLSVSGLHAELLGNSMGQRWQRMTQAVKADTYPQMCPLTVIGLRWVPRQRLRRAGVALETGSRCRAGLRAAIQVVLLGGSPSNMTNALSLAWRHCRPKLFISLEACLLSGGPPARVKSPAYGIQSSSCALQAFEMVASAQTKFVLFRRVFLCFIPLQELRLNACLVSGSLKRWRK